MWYNLLSEMRILRIIQDLYMIPKSCVTDGGVLSKAFPCDVGVRQGENLSPLFFCMFLHDLQSFLSEHSVRLESLQKISADF